MGQEDGGCDCVILSLTQGAKDTADRLVRAGFDVGWELASDDGTCLIAKGFGWLVTRLDNGPDDTEPVWACWDPPRALMVTMNFCPPMAEGFADEADAKRWVTLMAAATPLRAVRDDIDMRYPVFAQLAIVAEDEIVQGPMFVTKDGSENRMTDILLLDQGGAEEVSEIPDAER